MLDFVTLQLYGKYTLHNKSVSTRSTLSHMFKQQLEPGKLWEKPTQILFLYTLTPSWQDLTLHFLPLTKDHIVALNI